MMMIGKGIFKRFEKCRDGQITTEELANWADAITLRDDIGFETDEMLEIIFELANPEVNGKISETV
jgi:Ca2+-binding EF-hand superfamily protein